jgi:serine/threonine protein kinase
LRQLCERKSQKESVWSSIPEKTVVEWALMICSAMEYVHSKGTHRIVVLTYADILHRDLKPSNIFVTEVEGKTVLKIGDFGLSYELVKTKSRASTRAGTMIYVNSLC